MVDRYQRLANTPAGRFVTKQLGVPAPTPLRRYEPGQPALAGPALLGATPGGRLVEPLARVLGSIGAEALLPPGGELREAAVAAGVRSTAWSPDEDGDRRFGALVYDASGIDSPERLRDIYAFLHPVIRQVASSGRLLVLGTPPGLATGPDEAVAQRALEGLVRSAGKEIGGKGATANLVQVAPDAEEGVEATLRFFLSAKSAYVSGQVVTITAGEAAAPDDWSRPLQGKVTLVTGASRGIGEAIAETLARDGAEVACLDVPAQGDALAEVANRVGGSAIQLDITADAAPGELAAQLRERHGGVDVVVHNAGVTRDKTLGRMEEDQWEAVLAVNLLAPLRINETLLAEELVRQGGRIVAMSSVSGVAGNRGQANYAASKAGLIGMVQSQAPLLAPLPATINAVAPGFIETQMTAAMPLVTREAGRRMNSLTQGGLPIDVAETVAWLASPGSGGITANVVRVCGQGLIGA